MTKLWRRILVLFSILFVINIPVRVHSTSNDELHSNSSTVARSRMKRYLIFQPGTRLFFRVNTKDNVIRINEIWAHGFGFRANIDLLQPQRPKRSLRRSEVYETLKELINQHGFNGTACILKTFCDASKELTQKSGMLFKLFKLIFTQPSTDDRLTATDDRKDSYWTSNNCDEFTRQCPLWLLKLTPYTDI